MSGTVLFLGGILNIADPFIGLTIYMWLMILILFFAGCVWLLFRFGVWSKYKTLWGLYYAFKAESNAAFIFNLQLVAELYSEAQAKCIFNYAKYEYEGFSKHWYIAWFERRVFNYATVFLDDLDPLMALVYKYGHRNMDVEIAKKLQNYKDWESNPSVTIGGISTDIILDADRWTVPTSYQHKAIEAYCELWNEAHPDDQIHSYSKFQKYIASGKISLTESIGCITPEVTIPWTRIDASFPIDVEDNEQAGARRQQAEDEAIADSMKINQYIPHILVGGFIFALVIVGLRFLSIMFAAPKPI